MRLAVISCKAYSDAVGPFITLLDEFWPGHPELWLVTDEQPVAEIADRCSVFVHPGAGQASWGPRLARFTDQCTDNILLFQEDFFLHTRVRENMVEHAAEQMRIRNAGSVRLFPCPGSNEDYGDPYVGTVKRFTPYRISCQVTLWQPAFLHRIIRRCRNPWDLEIDGSRYSSFCLDDEVLAWKREAEPWPMEYLCSAIGRGRWSQDARLLCEREGIQVDWARRGFQTA